MLVQCPNAGWMGASAQEVDRWVCVERGRMLDSQMASDVRVEYYDQIDIVIVIGKEELEAKKSSSFSLKIEIYGLW